MLTFGYEECHPLNEVEQSVNRAISITPAPPGDDSDRQGAGVLIPAFIEWSPGPHPSTGQQDIGVRLKSVQLTYPDPDALGNTLKALGVDHLVDVTKGARALRFEVECPAGTVTLD